MHFDCTILSLTFHANDNVDHITCIYLAVSSITQTITRKIVHMSDKNVQGESLGIEYLNAVLSQVRKDLEHNLNKDKLSIHIILFLFINVSFSMKYFIPAKCNCKNV